MADQSEKDCTVQMEEILEKLKLLNYEREFLQKNGTKHINRAYFAIQLNQSEQFNTFKLLIEWLFKLNDVKGIDFYSDPNTVSQSILFEMKNLGFEYSFPPLKLSKGSGFYVCQLLLDLVNRAVEKKFQFKKPKQIKNKDKVEEQSSNLGGGDDNKDEDGDQMRDDVSIGSDDIEDDANLGGGQNYNQEMDENKAMIETQIDKRQWIVECKRVAPKLTINPKADSKEWRAHIEQTKNYQDNIKKILPDSRNRLEKVSDSLGKILEQIGKREKNINTNMTDLGGEYKQKSEKLKQIMIMYNNLDTSVKDMSEQYRQVTEKHEVLSDKIKNIGDGSTDQSPVIKAKQALNQLRNEIKQMDLRIGVLSHTILNQKLRAKQNYDIDNVEIEQIQEQEQQEQIDELDDF